MKTILRDQNYLDYLCSQPCIITGQYSNDNDTVDAMHIGTAGKGIKSPDDETLPVLHSLHRQAHQEGEMSFLRRKIPNWLLRDMCRAYARELYRKWKGTEDE